MNVTCIDKINDFHNLRTEWNKLLERSPANTIFLTWEWLYSWWEIFGKNKKLFILCLKNGGELAGIAPFYVENKKLAGVFNVKTIRFLGTGIVASDYLDILLTPQTEYKILEKIFSFLSRNADQWDMLLLEDIPEQSPTLQILPSIVDLYNLSLRKLSTRTCCYLSAPGHWDDYLKLLSHNRRKKIRQGIKRLEQALSPTFKIVQKDNELQPALEALSRFHQEKFENTNRLSSFSFPNFTEFHRKVASNLLRKDRLFMTCLKVQDEIIAVNYAFRYCNKVYDYNGGFNQEYSKHSLGTILTAMNIKNAIQEGVKEWDFTRGEAIYKNHLAKGKRENIILLIGKKNIYESVLLVKRALIKNASTALQRYFPSSLYEFLNRAVKKKRYL